jgi:hypothetical protein
LFIFLKLKFGISVPDPQPIDRKVQAVVRRLIVRKASNALATPE